MRQNGKYFAVRDEYLPIAAPLSSFSPQRPPSCSPPFYTPSCSPRSGGDPENLRRREQKAWISTLRVKKTTELRVKMTAGAA